MITFGLFVWFTMKFVWPPIIKALEERQHKIADGLAAGERGQRELELAQHNVAAQLRDTKIQSAEILEHAQRRAAQMIDEAKDKAREEGKRLVELAQGDVAQLVNSAKTQLRNQVAVLAVSGAQQVLQKNIDVESNRALVDNLIEQL